jgi:uncharacterized membrane protein HdeD (DUF308 family)
MNANMISGIVLIVVGLGQIFWFAFPLWLIVLCVGIMFILER